MLMLNFIPQSDIVRGKRQYGKVDAEDKKLLAQQMRAEARIVQAFMQYLKTMRGAEMMRQFEVFYRRGSVPNIQDLINGPLREFAKILPKVFITAANESTEDYKKEFDINIVRKVDVEAGIDLSFDPGDAAAATAMREMQLDLIREITEAQREAIRVAMTRALSDGLGFEAAGRSFRDTIGLTAYQNGAVDNFERMLRQNNSAALNRVLRDKRFDPTIRRAIEQSRQLTEKQITQMTNRYRDRFIAMRAETIARTEGLRAVNTARHQAMGQLATKAGIQMSRIQRIWRAVGDTRTRHTHRMMNGQIRGANQRFVSPSGAKLMHPGERGGPPAEVINCRCALQIKFLEESAVVAPPKTLPPPATPVTQERLLAQAAWHDSYKTLKQAHEFDFPSGARFYAKDPELLSLFRELEDQVVQTLKAVEAAQTKLADEIVKASVQTSLKLEAADPKRAKLFTQWVRLTARNREIPFELQNMTSVGSSVLIRHPDGSYYVPAGSAEAPVGTGLAVREFTNYGASWTGRRPRSLDDVATKLFNKGTKTKLEQASKNALSEYTGSAFLNINKGVEKYLRTPADARRNYSSYVTSRITELDSVFTQVSLPENLVVFRSMGMGRFNKTFPNLVPGEALVLDNGFVSTSMYRDAISGFYTGSSTEMVIEILLPKGSKALSLFPVSHHASEYEILLNRGSTFIVREVTKEKVILELVV